MGSWGERPYENDTALDWLGELEQMIAQQVHDTLRAYLNGDGDAQAAEAAASLLYELTAPIEGLPLWIKSTRLILRIGGLQSEPAIFHSELLHFSRLTLDYYSEEFSLFAWAIDAMTKYCDSDLSDWVDPDEKRRCITELIELLQKKRDALEKINR